MKQMSNSVGWLRQCCLFARYVWRHPRKTLRLLCGRIDLGDGLLSRGLSVSSRLSIIRALSLGVSQPAGWLGEAKFGFTRASRAWASAGPSAIDDVSVLIPVYNGFEHLSRLLPSLARNTHANVEILFWDDASPDLRVRRLLESFVARRHGSRILSATKNEGFVRSVNRAAKYAKRHFVILNSDTEVPPGWLERITAPIWADGTVASATPFSNSATIFSFPVPNQDNVLPAGLDCTQIDQAFQSLPDDEWVESLALDAPTGVGFCMAINGDIWRRIGGFDEEKFGRGYGEENDWCQRAIAAGYRNVLVPNLFVFHNHGGSFASDEKRRLCEEHLEKLKRTWPHYLAQVARHVRADRWAPLRDRALARLVLAQNPLVILDHELGGGANAYSRRLIEEFRGSGRPIVALSYSADFDLYRGSFDLAGTQVVLVEDDFRRLIASVNLRASADIVCNELVSWPDPVRVIEHLQELVALAGVRVEVPVHDYFSVCPSYCLLGSDSRYCGVPTDIDHCHRCLLSNPHSQYSVRIDEWRSAWSGLLAVASTVTCFSESSRQIMTRAFPEMAGRFIVKPHQPVLALVPIAVRAPSSKPVVAVVGGINFQKGSRVVIELCHYLSKSFPDAKVVVVGQLDRGGQAVPRNLTIHGRYEGARLGEILAHYGVGACLLPSIWPETFSYVTQEIMMLGLPLVCFNLGAPAERVKHYPRGVVLDSQEPEAIWNALQAARTL